MKHGIKPTKKQKQLIASRKLDYRDWLVERDLHDHMIIVHRTSHNKRKIYKVELW